LEVFLLAGYMIFSVCYAIVVSLLVIGIALAIAGVITTTILDRSRIIRVTQFNDIGYLIYWI
jgi:VIT1/CCC1 family predicted Fe2+/Mn2+ transporter